jgi:rhamnose utilization protein RhaD (predicted bifunctional aldolase and dehydrogenase)
MPHTVVVHLHAIEVLAHLVRPDFERELALALDRKFNWASVSYEKPGAELARAVHGALLHVPEANVIFLQSHGVVIGGSDVADVDATLKSLIERLRIPPRAAVNFPVPDRSIDFAGHAAYSPVQDVHIQQLALDMALLKRLETDWVLYPDHVVFLGAKANVYDTVDSMKRILAISTNLPELMFVKGIGVFVQPGFSVAKNAQLRCYYDVLTRQEAGTILGSLKLEQIAELLNWDAEKYRMQVAK